MIKFLFFLILLCSSCETKNSSHTSDNQGNKNNKDANITLVPFSLTQKQPSASLKFMRFLKGKLDFQLSNFELGNKKGLRPEINGYSFDENGNHIHLIIDNKTSKNYYSSRFDLELEDGPHYLAAFLSSPYHESVKNMNAGRVGHAMIEKGKIQKFNSLEIPILVYNQPKGTFKKSDSDEILLDFQLFNFNLGDNFKVKVEINDAEFMIDKWESYGIKGLKPGKHSVILTLLDANGEATNTPFNPVRKTFVIEP